MANDPAAIAPDAKQVENPSRTLLAPPAQRSRARFARSARWRRLTPLLWLLPLFGVMTGAFFCLRNAWIDVNSSREAIYFRYLGGRIEWSSEMEGQVRGQVVGISLANAGRMGRVTDADVRRLARLPRLESLDLSQCGSVTGAGLQVLAGLTALEHLYLGDGEIPGPRVTDAELVNVSRLTRLKSLSLAGSSITDAGLARLKGLNNLEHIDLKGTRVTDAGLATLKQLPRLQCVFLERTCVTGQAALDLLRARPGLEVHHEILDDEASSNEN